MSKSMTMDDLLAQSELQPLAMGDVVEGKVLTVHKHEVWVDLGARGIGVIPRRELGGASLEPDTDITASIIDPETDEGYAQLSIRRAAKDKGWEELVERQEAEESIEVVPYDANRGGLLIEVSGIRGFLPVSQLSADNYPRVTGSDKDEILQRLHSLVGKTIKVRILDIDRKDNKLIVSEKEALKEDIAKRFTTLKVGDKVKGLITGVIDFGAFVNVDGIEGLIHISEISWERVEDPRKHISVGDEVEAKIISIDKERLSLSLKQMMDDPWTKEVEGLEKGSKVEGTITRITPFGAFVQIKPSVEALVHISEMGTGKTADDENADPERIFKLGEKKTFKVIDIDASGRKIALSLK